VSPPRRLLLSPQAAADLTEIAAFIARDNPARAASFVAELETKCRSVAATPDLYPLREDLAPGLRMAVHGRYLLFYRDLPMEGAVRVERVLHGARDLSRLPVRPHSPAAEPGRFRAPGRHGRDAPRDP